MKNKLKNNDLNSTKNNLYYKYNSLSNDTYNTYNVIPVVRYINAYTDKSAIYRDNKNKCGVYRWINIINGKSYVGSSISLKNRFSVYYSIKSLKTKRPSIIYRALLKYGHTQFSLDILEYCEPSILISREQYYIDLLKPEYNICKTAGSTLGKAHSISTKEKIV